MRRFLLLAPALLLASPAFASAVTGCNYEGAVVSIVEDVDGKKGELAIELKVSLSEGFGHSGPPAPCVGVGETLRFEVDDDAAVRKEALKAGERIKVSWMTSWNITEKGASTHSRQTFDGRIPAPAEVVAPERPVPG